MRIARVETSREHVPLTRPYAIAGRHTSDVVLFFARIVPERGAPGVGCASPAEHVTGETVEACAAALDADRLGTMLAGRDLCQLGTLSRAVEEALLDAPAARAAVDVALWDAFTRHLDVSLVDFLGRCHDFLPTSITIGIKDAEQTLEEAAEYVGRGFRVLKVKLGLALGEDLERLRRLREAVGQDIRLRVDANEGYDLADTRRLLGSAESLRLELIEQPMPREDNDQLDELPDAQRELLALDESIVTGQDAIAHSGEPLLARTWVLKLMKCGGVTPALRQAAIARAARRKLMWGCMDESAVSIAAALHAAYACPATRYLDLDGAFDLSRDPARGGFALEQGQLVLTGGPGVWYAPLMSRVRVLVAGCGNMGAAHARAYRAIDGFEVVGLVSRGPASRERLAAELGGGLATFADFDAALAATAPDAVSINTYPDTHHELARRALRAGAHVFVEKPLAVTVEQAQELVDLSREQRLALVVGYILRVHPTWQRFVEIARTLGKPLAMRMNLNQQSRGKEWVTHKSLMRSTSPIVDCGVHYVDVMCQMTGARPARVSAVGARLTDEVAPSMYNYGQLQVAFDDGSVGWYECGWGPMMSEVAYFVKDVIGPRGCVSIVEPGGAERRSGSADVGSHTATNCLRVHRQDRDESGEFVHRDEWIDTTGEPDHDALCRREQELFLAAICGAFDPSDHLRDAVDSLRIVLAADRAVREGRTIEL